VPEISIPRNTLVVLCGPAGSGKSTFAARHFAPSQIVSSDECRALVSDDPTDQSVSGHAFELMHYIIGKRLRLGRLTVADATHLKRIERKPLISLTRRFAFNSALIVFDIPLELCLARNKRRERVIPEDALRLQYDLAQRVCKQVSEEGLDYIVTVDELTQNEIEFAIGRRVNRRRRR
jgi:protein phosphatase